MRPFSLPLKKAKSSPKLNSFFTSQRMFLFWLCSTPYVRNHCPSTDHKALAPYIRVATLASKSAFPVAPYPKWSFRSFSHLELFRKSSSEMRHAAESPGKLPHRLLSANLEEPSRRREAVRI